jgi:hypothetical protein
VEFGNVEVSPMIDDWDEREDAVAAGSICPVADWCDFTCLHCGIDFSVPEDELIFQAVPKEWLLARVQAT